MDHARVGDLLLQALGVDDEPVEDSELEAA